MLKDLQAIGIMGQDALMRLRDVFTGTRSDAGYSSGDILNINDTGKETTSDDLRAWGCQLS